MTNTPFDNTAVIRNHAYASILLLALFIILQASLQERAEYGDLCEIREKKGLGEEDESYSIAWVHMQTSAFVGFMLVYLIKACLCLRKEKNKYHYLSICSIPMVICVIEICSLAMIDSGGGVVYCTTAFGLSLPMQLWIEWLITLPFLAFATTVINEEVHSSYKNKVIITCVCLSVSAILSTAFVTEQLSAITLIAVAGISYLVSAVTCILLQRQSNSKSILPSTFDIYERDHKPMEWKQIVFNIRVFVLLIMLIFFFLYLLGNLQLLSSTQIYVCFSVSNLITKIGYTSYLCDSHAAVLDAISSFSAATTFGQSSRKEFMRYVFHELRNPLNSIALGVDLLNKQREDEEVLDPATFSLIKESVSYISDTLADVSMMDSIEDGGITLHEHKFLLKDSITRALEPLQSLARIKRVALRVIVSPTVPNEFIGDRERVELVVNKFVSHSLRRSSVGGKVTLVVEPKPNTKHIQRSTFSLKWKDGMNSPFSGHHAIAAAMDLESRIASGNPSPRSSFAEVHSSSLAEHESNSIDDKNSFRLVFRVLDDCCGFGSQDLDRLFKPFNTLQANDSKDQSSGPANGLGLALARDIIEVLGGKLEMTPSLDACSFGVKLGFSIPLQLSAESILFPLSTRSSVQNYPYSAENSAKYANNYHHQLGFAGGDINRRMVTPNWTFRTGRTASTTFSLPQTGYNSAYNSTKERSVAHSYAIQLNQPAEANASEPHQSHLHLRNPGTIERDLSIKSVQSQCPALNDSRDEIVSRHEANVLSLSTTTTPHNSAPPTSFNPQGLRRFLLVDGKLTLFAIFIIADSFLCLDVQANNKMLSMALKNMGLLSDSVENGALAVEAITRDKDRYEAIFLDYTMPVMDGGDACKAIRELGFNRLIIGVTGNSLADDVTKFLACGVDIVIPKPMRPAQLRAVVNYIRFVTSISDANHKLVLSSNTGSDVILVEKEYSPRERRAYSTSSVR
jgi:signal transduction histidine kinase/FixJ family two-component response regulator